jgi:aldose 1-epimerase
VGRPGTGALCETGLRPIGSTPVPLGYGAHPFFTVAEDVVDHIVLELPATSYLEVDKRLLPVRLLPVEGTEKDFRTHMLWDRSDWTRPSPI